MKDFLEASGVLSLIENTPELNGRVALLTVGGSYACGTNREGSDIDIRGVALNSAEEILLGRDFEQIVDKDADNTIYSINKFIQLITSCNPNAIEMLGCKPDQYFMVDEAGQLLLDNKVLFLSQRASKTFAGYANQQLRRLENKSNRFANQRENEEHILSTIRHQELEFKRKYPHFDTDIFRTYIDDSTRGDMRAEIFIDADLRHFPIREFKEMWTDMYNIVNSYNTLGYRNSKAFAHGKIAKHSMHLVRLYYMAFDILEKKQIITYREAEHDLLMSIRNGDFLDENEKPTPEFYELVDELEKRFEYARKNTDLPVEPDLNRIDELRMEINRSILGSKYGKDD